MKNSIVFCAVDAKFTSFRKVRKVRTVRTGSDNNGVRCDVDVHVRCDVLGLLERR